MSNHDAVSFDHVVRIMIPTAADQRSVMAGLLETKINLTHNLRVNGAHTGLRPATRQVCVLTVAHQLAYNALCLLFSLVANAPQ